MRAVEKLMTLDSGRILPPRTLDLACESDFAIGPMSVKPSASEVELTGVAHKIEPRVMQVLVALARAEGAVVSRDDLIQTCWGGLIVGEDAINRVIGRVRRIAELTDPPAFRIETIPKIGYRLIPAPAAERAAPRPVAPAVMPGPIRRNRLFAAALVLGLAGAAAAAWFIPSLRPPAREGEGEKVVTVAAPRLAIMPFDVEGAREDQGYLAEGIAEEIHDRLTKFENLKVIGFSSAIALGGVTDDVQELGRRLGASFLLQGGLRREGDALGLSFELIDARNGAQIWFDSFEGALKDVPRIEEEVERGIASALDVAFPASAAAPNISSGNPNAYELYLKGLAAFRRFETGGDDGAIALLSRAIELDPTLNAARARLALSYAMHADNVVRAEGNFAAHARTLKLSSETALAALAIEPQNAVALTALGAVRMQEKLYNEAHTLFDYVRDIAPEEEAATISLSVQLASAGYVEEARTLTSDAMRIHPASARVVGYLAMYEMLLGDYESALVHAELAYSLKFPPGRWRYVISMVAVGRADEAADVIAADLAATVPSEERDWRENFWRMTLGAFRDEAGRERYVAAIRTRLDENDPEHFDTGAAEILNLLGESELRDRLLLDKIDTGLFDRNPGGVSYLWAPWASSVRASPQFKELVVRMRFVPYWKEHGWPNGCRPKGADDFECG